MVRPGPKTTQDEVKAAVVSLLKQHPEGLNFNKIFKVLKGQKVLGSFSVLARAMKDLSKAGIVAFEDAQASGSKIPKRVYRLSTPMEQDFRRIKQKESVPLKDVMLQETLLNHLFLTLNNNLLSAYRLLLHEKNPSADNARWKFILNYEIKYIQAFMDAVAQAVTEGRIPIEKADKVAYEVNKRILGETLQQQSYSSP